MHGIRGASGDVRGPGTWPSPRSPRAMPPPVHPQGVNTPAVLRMQTSKSPGLEKPGPRAWAGALLHAAGMRRFRAPRIAALPHRRRLCVVFCPHFQV